MFSAWTLLLGAGYLIFVITFVDTANGHTTHKLVWKVIPAVLLVAMVVASAMEFGLVIAK